jgi:hypothetical protein
VHTATHADPAPTATLEAFQLTDIRVTSKLLVSMRTSAPPAIAQTAPSPTAGRLGGPPRSILVSVPGERIRGFSRSPVNGNKNQARPPSIRTVTITRPIL